MQLTHLQTAIAPRLATTLVWALVLLSGGYWTQALLSSTERPVSGTPPAVLPAPVTNASDMARLLGASPQATNIALPGDAERWRLAGVIADGNGQGVALISVDGKPARPFAVGAQLEPGSVLIAVRPKEALIADDLQSPVRTVLQLTPQAAPSSVRVNAEPALPVAPSTGHSPTAAPPAESAVVPAGPPPRADSRRQLPMSSRREDRPGP